MRKDHGGLLILAHGGMVLSWLYAWASFLMTAVTNQPFPLPEALGTFILAATLVLVVRGRGLRVLSVLGLHTMGFLLAASRTLYSFNDQEFPYFGKEWLLEIIYKTVGPMEWLILLIILIFALVLWIAGVALARRSTMYLVICSRFDYGVAAFFCLFMIKSLLLIKGGIEVRDPAPMLLLFSFIIFSLLAIGLARNRSEEQRNYLAGYKAVGVIVSFTLVIIAFGASLALLFMPYLSVAAQAGYGVLKSTAGPLVPIVVRVLNFLFLGARLRQDPSSFSPGEDEAEFIGSGESSWWGELVATVLGWGLIVLWLSVGLFLFALGTWLLMRWLFSRTSKEEIKHIHWPLSLLWIGRLWTALCTSLKRVVQRLKGHRDVVQLYRALLKWGRRSGLPHLLSETPVEYGLRLREKFPFLTGEINGIIEAFNLAVYGELNLNDEQITLAKLSWKRLRKPRYWPARLKSWFLQG